MKNALYHICLTAHDEVLLRNEDDARLFTNLNALAAYRTNSTLLTDAIMSTHIHDNVYSSRLHDFLHSLKLTSTKAFNSKYGRHGRLFDEKTFAIEIKGPQHTLMSINYGLRQGLHHGVSESAFSYPYCTTNEIFSEARGVSEKEAFYKGSEQLQPFFPKNATIPDGWCADRHGILTRSCYENIPLLETWYGTSKNFMWNMLRTSSEQWLQEQDADGVQSVRVSLELLEYGFTSEDIACMHRNEGNRKFIKTGKTDMDICKIIDAEILPKLHVRSVYHLNADQKIKIFNDLRNKLGIRNEKQLSRCLAMKYVR